MIQIIDSALIRALGSRLKDIFMKEASMETRKLPMETRKLPALMILKVAQEQQKDQLVNILLLA
jgi:hypothetical protein